MVWSAPRADQHIVGFGVAVELEGGPCPEIQWLSAPPPPLPLGPFFGGWEFDPRRGWPGFGGERWYLPRVLAFWSGGAAWIAAFGDASQSAADLRAAIDSFEEQEPPPRLVARLVPESSDGYESLVREALAAIADGAFEKLVVARTLTVESDNPFDDRRVLKTLESSNPGSVTFLFRGRDGRAFVGSTPELLAYAEGERFETEAVAGTAATASSASLLDSAKDRREHELVVEGLLRSLSPYAAELSRPQAPELRAVGSLVHLRTPFVVRLKDGVDPLLVARAIHPTAAVAGLPQATSRDWLAAHEHFPRGFYAGVIGARSATRLHLVVGLRSALLDGNRAQIFVGAGIVPGSDPQLEAKETNAKALTMLRALGVAHG